MPANSRDIWTLPPVRLASVIISSSAFGTSLTLEPTVAPLRVTVHLLMASSAAFIVILVVGVSSSVVIVARPENLDLARSGSKCSV